MSKAIRNLKIGVSGVRGSVDDALTMHLAAQFAATFGTFVGRGRIVVGRDTRASGRMVELAVASGLLSVGCQPLCAGIIPTPTVQILVEEHHAAGGISISASHNPANWNALKFVRQDGILLDAGETASLLNMYNQGDIDFVPEQDILTPEELSDPFAFHKARIFAQIDVESIRRRHFKVAMDCCNGAGALYSEAFLRELGCEVIPIFDSYDGGFEREPEPRPEHLSKLCQTVVENHCDIGFAQDPDADRLAIVGPSGTPVGENYPVVLAVRHVLSKTPGPVVVNAATSMAVEKVAASFGCPIHYSKVGEVNVVSRMLEVGAVIGGEANGGVIWPAVHPCRDSFAGMALILDSLAGLGHGLDLDAALDAVPRYHTAMEKVDVAPEQARILVQELRRRHASERMTLVDGMRLDWEDGWVLVRPSNTEPVIRIQSEGGTRERAEELAKSIRKECEGLLANLAS